MTRVRVISKHGAIGSAAQLNFWATNIAKTAEGCLLDRQQGHTEAWACLVRTESSDFIWWNLSAKKARTVILFLILDYTLGKFG